MGQPHQIYIVTENEGIIGIHHKWLYGNRAIRLLRNFLSFFPPTTMPSFTPWFVGNGNIKDFATACYSYDHTDNYFFPIYQFESWEPELEDPTKGDNNEGITIIDVTTKIPTYCFVVLDELQSAAKDVKFTTLIPLTAEKYLRCYYPKKLNKEQQKNLALIANYPLMTIERLKQIFPKMFKTNKTVPAKIISKRISFIEEQQKENMNKIKRLKKKLKESR